MKANKTEKSSYTRLMKLTSEIVGTSIETNVQDRCYKCNIAKFKMSYYL